MATKRKPPGRKPAAGLTPQQRRFVEEYMKDLNATHAAVRAGYSKKTAGVQGHDLLKRPKIAAEVKKRMDARSRQNEITADRVLKELARIGFSDMRDLVGWGPKGVAIKSSRSISDDAAAAVSEVSEMASGRLRLKLHSKDNALMQIARHLGMFRDTIQIDGEIKFSDVANEFTRELLRLAARKKAGQAPSEARR